MYLPVSKHVCIEINSLILTLLEERPVFVSVHFTINFMGPFGHWIFIRVYEGISQCVCVRGGGGNFKCYFSKSLFLQWVLIQHLIHVYEMYEICPLKLK